ncbi:lysylphosphatidylglycerol synthase domain-containing protein [Lysobacter tyrosinilyticus]
MKHRHPRLYRLWRAALWIFPVVVLALLARAARAIDWPQVRETLADYDIAILLVAGMLTTASYLVYSTYDVAARRYAHHTVSTRRVMLITGIAYAFALNIGALIGGTGARFRMYAREGLGVATISRIVAFSASSNWLGYLLLAGALFASGTITMPARWASAVDSVQMLGIAMIVAALAYLVACHRLHDHVYHVRRHHFRLPSLRLALVQFALSMLNWSLMAAIIFVLLPAPVDYPTVLGACLFAAIATALVHVPAGLGVLEAVFVAAFAQRVPAPQVLAALLAYRAIYYLAPLAVAVVLYLVFETRRSTSDVASQAQSPQS